MLSRTVPQADRVEVRADAGKIDDGMNTGCAEDGCLPETAPLQDGRSVENPSRDDDLCLGRDIEDGAISQRSDFNNWQFGLGPLGPYDGGSLVLHQ